jgi:transcriptional regulator with XRE-family HTH domain
VGTSERAYDHGVRRGQRLLATIGNELRDARLSNGTSQATIARAARMPISKISRIENARLPSLSVSDATLLASLLGLDLSARTYLGPDPLRDRAQATKIGELLRHVRQPLRSTTEALLPAKEGIPERRRWDALMTDGVEEMGVEVEMRLHDAQAQTGRLRTKARDGLVDRVLLVVAATRHNRQVLRDFPAYFADWPRLRTAAVLADLESGRLPPSGLILF